MSELCPICRKLKETGECICDIQYPLNETEYEVVENFLNLTTEEQLLLKKIEEKQKLTDPLLGNFNSWEDKPTTEQIESWKKMYGDIYVQCFGEGEFYIFRPLKRIEWKTLAAQMAKIEDEAKRKEMICMKAVVYPDLRAENIGSLKALTPDSIYEAILRASNFLLPDEALSLVRKL